tara:strand:+ start:6530 stop:8056 length:1527 start_codon:yes stop_codon:yes gene_type:complete
MNPSLIILRKDLRLYRWGWICALIVAGINIYLHGTTHGMIESKFTGSLQTLSGIGQALLPFFLFALVTQKENLVDPEAYWLGRPIPRLQILSSKLIFAAIIVGIFTLGDVAVLVLNGGADRVPYALGGFFALFAAWLSVVFLGAQTKSLPRLLALIFLFYIGMMIFGLLLAPLVSNWEIIEEIVKVLPMLPFDMADHHVALIHTIFWTAASISILAFYYKTKKRKTAWLILAACGIATIVLSPRDERGAFSPNSDKDSEPRLSATIIGISKVGTQTSNRGETNRYALQLESSEGTLPENIWLQPNSVEITLEDGTELSEELFPITNSQKVHSTPGQPANEFQIDAFHFDPQYADWDLASPVQVDLYSNIKSYSGKEVGRIPLQVNQSFANSGNRILISSYGKAGEQLSVELSAYLPAMILEPNKIEGFNQAFKGIYSFGLSTGPGAVVIPLGMRGMGFSMSSSYNASLEVNLPRGTNLKECELVIYKRELLQSGYTHISGRDIQFPKN